SIRPDLLDEDIQRLRRHIAECLAHRGGEVSARARAAELGRCYLNLSAVGRRRFLELLARDYAVDRGEVGVAIRAYQDAEDAAGVVAPPRQLSGSTGPPRPPPPPPPAHP